MRMNIGGKKEREDYGKKVTYKTSMTCFRRDNNRIYVREAKVHTNSGVCGTINYNGKEIGECDYSTTESGWNIYHTGVSSDYQGKGIAKRLVYKVLEEAERNCVNVSATCYNMQGNWWRSN